jgi:3-deoxy-manno-octulosonate cytidylyltransferase (CMP-KDO synthetase)
LSDKAVDKPDFQVVIPARYHATRLPGKPLRDMSGKPMIQRVHEVATNSGAGRVVIATDDERIRESAEAFGAHVCMTSSSHRSGTERIAEAVAQLGCSDSDIVVNLQGDEPHMPAELLGEVAANLSAHPQAGITTLCTPIESAEELLDPNVVKVVRDEAGYGLYFSRAPIPWLRDKFPVSSGPLPAGAEFLRHIGLYAYRVEVLKAFVAFPESALAQAESLEQLRALANGIKVQVALASKIPPAGIDTEEDLQRALAGPMHRELSE